MCVCQRSQVTHSHTRIAHPSFYLCIKPGESHTPRSVITMHPNICIRLLLVLILCVCSTVRARVYERCELARELRDKHQISQAHVPIWVCIAQHESNYNTSAVNWDSGDHGLFQISNLFWCSPPGNGHACGLSCASLEDDNIEDDIACAKRIHREHTRLSGDGFNAWVVYQTYCKGPQVQKYVEGCFQNRVAGDNLLVRFNDKSSRKLQDNPAGYYAKPTQYSTTPRVFYSPTTKNYYQSTYRKPTYTVTPQKSVRNDVGKSNIYSREIHKLPTRVLEHESGSRYKYHIGNMGFVLFRDN